MGKKYIEVDDEVLTRIESKLDRMESALEKAKLLEKTEYLSPEEFCEKIKCGRTMYDMLMKQGRLKYTRVRRKVFIPETEVERFFKGEIYLEE